jgi:2'-5' RNA ligase
MRLFFAIFPDENLKTELVALQQKIQTQFPQLSIKWSQPENLHLTLRFLGEIDNEKAQHLQAIEMPQHHSFNLALEKLKPFSSAKQPRSLVITLALSSALAKLMQSIDQVISQAQLPLEQRPYIPHITLGKIKNNNTVKMPEMTALQLPSLPALKVKEIILVHSESQTLPGNSNIYHHLKQWPL